MTAYKNTAGKLLNMNKDETFVMYNHISPEMS